MHFSVTSGVKYGTIHISVGLFDLCAEFDFKRRFLHAKTLICDISCADSGDRNFRRNGVWCGKTTQVDTITLETQTADDEVAVDLGWKTQQDKGRWIDKMGIADDVNSLVLIINNIENDTDTVKTNTGNGSSDKVVKVKRKQLPGNSRMLYLSRTENGVWQENFSVNCYYSGAQGEDSDIYGVYRWKAPLETKMIREVSSRIIN